MPHTGLKNRRKPTFPVIREVWMNEDQKSDRSDTFKSFTLGLGNYQKGTITGFCREAAKTALKQYHTISYNIIQYLLLPCPAGGVSILSDASLLMHASPGVPRRRLSGGGSADRPEGNDFRHCEIIGPENGTLENPLTARRWQSIMFASYGHGPNLTEKLIIRTGRHGTAKSYHQTNRNSV